MARKKAEIDLDSLVETSKEQVEDITEPASKEAATVKELKEDDLVVKPEEVKPLQTFAKEPAQPFYPPQEDAFRGVGGSYFIDSNGTRVKRIK